MREKSTSSKKVSTPITKSLAALLIVVGITFLAINDPFSQSSNEPSQQTQVSEDIATINTDCNLPDEWAWDEDTCKTTWENWQRTPGCVINNVRILDQDSCRNGSPSNWAHHVKRDSCINDLLIPRNYVGSHSTETQDWFYRPMNCPADFNFSFESIWWDPQNPDRSIQLIGQTKSDSTPWVKEGLFTQLFESKSIFDPSAVIEEALLEIDPSLLGAVAEVTERAACRFDFSATSDDGITTEGIWVPHGHHSSPLGYYLFITTGMNWDDTWMENDSDPTYPDFKRNFWYQFLEGSGHNSTVFGYHDSRWGENKYENCFSLNKMVLDGETRTILNESFPINGFIDDFTDLPCDEPIPQEVRAWFYERYGNSSNHTGEFADASYGNEELTNFQYANIVPEPSGPIVLELLAQDSCYWFDKDEWIRNPWDKNTTMTLHPDVDPLPGSVVGIIEGEERDQLIVGKSAGPRDEWVGSPVLVRDFNVCCETPYTLEVYEWREGSWHEVENALGKKVETSEAIALAPFQAINPSLKGCDITFGEQYIPEEPNYPIPPPPTAYEIKNVKISCNLSTPLLGLGPLYNDLTVSRLGSHGLKSFSYEIIVGTEHDDLINDQIRNFFGNSLASHLENGLLPSDGMSSAHVSGNWWSAVGGTAYHDDTFFSVTNIFTYDHGGTSRYGEKEYWTFFVETGEILEISDLFIGEDDSLWREIFSENAHQVTGGYDCRKYSEEEYGDGNSNSLVMTSDVWPTAEGLMSQNTLEWTKVYANNCRDVMWLTPWEHFSDIADPDGFVAHYVAKRLDLLEVT